jgi:hypothetical protein
MGGKGNYPEMVASNDLSFMIHLTDNGIRQVIYPDPTVNFKFNFNSEHTTVGLGFHCITSVWKMWLLLFIYLFIFSYVSAGLTNTYRVWT